MSVGELTVDRPAARLQSRRAVVLALVFCAVTAVLIPVAYASMFTGFHAYDDEGYFLMTLRSYLSGEPLLNPTLPIYGPFFYEAMAGLFKLIGQQPTHDTGRIVTAAVWILASAAGGLGAYRLTRNAWLGVGTQLATFGVLAALANEPMEPFGLTSLLLTSLVATAAFRSARPRFTAFLIGAIVAAVCLIKVNIGGFAAIAVVFAWSGGLPNPWRRFVRPIAAAVMVCVPFALMQSLLSHDWVIEFAVLATLSALAIGGACLVAPPGPQPPASTGWMAGGGAAVAVATVGIALAGGSTVPGMWNELVVVALRLPQLISLPLTITAGYDLWALLLLLGALTVLSGRLRLHGTPEALARVAVGFFTWLVLLLPPDTIFLLALPLAWVATQAPPGDAGNPIDPYARLLVPSLALLECLQTYPAAGTQLSLASLAMVPVGAMILSDGVRQLRLAGVRRRAPIRLVSWVPRLAVSFNVAVFLLFALTAVAGFEADTALVLPGAENVRLPARQAGDLRALVAAIGQDCSGLITMPGMNSLYLWSGETPPPDLRQEIWWATVDAGRQEELVQQLQGRPRLCAVKNQVLIDFWAQGRPIPDRPLVRFIGSAFTASGTFGDYELLIRGSPG
ncbi:MAG TPA: hypothetical protein VFL27_05940 [Candidatus Dormibacteraeota bacterium]|nr:hypothetical protein [Candidatus Dormibacteraeota bacterium]